MPHNKSPRRQRRKDRRAAERATATIQPKLETAASLPNVQEPTIEPDTIAADTTPLQLDIRGDAGKTKGTGASPSGESSRNSTVKFIWKVPACALGFVGLLASVIQIYSLLPNIPISAEHMTDPKNPTTTQFEVYNDGLLDLHDVQLGLLVIDISWDGVGGMRGGSLLNVNVGGNPLYNAKLLEPGGRTTLPIN